MKEIVLPVSGGFARMDRVKISDLAACMKSEWIVVALVQRMVTIDGQKVDAAFMDSMALADVMVLLKMVNEELEPAGLANGVA